MSGEIKSITLAGNTFKINKDTDFDKKTEPIDDCGIVGAISEMTMIETSTGKKCLIKFKVLSSEYIKEDSCP